MTTAAARPSRPGLCSHACGSSNGGDEIRLDGTEASIEYFRPWHDHDVQAGDDTMTAKYLARQTFRAIPRHRVPDPARGCHTES